MAAHENVSKDQFGHVINSPMHIAWLDDVFVSPNSGEPVNIDFGDKQVPRHYHYFPNGGGKRYLSGEDGRSHCPGGSACPSATLAIRLSKAQHVAKMAHDPEFYANEGGWDAPVSDKRRTQIYRAGDTE
jgi:hypothetical protein